MNCGLCLHYLRANNKCQGCSSGRKVNGGCIKCVLIQMEHIVFTIKKDISNFKP